MATKTNPWAVGTSTIVNGGLVAFLLLMGLRVAVPTHSDPAPRHHIDLSDLNFLAPHKGQDAGGGGGGGSNELVDPKTGRMPRFEKAPLVAPQVPLLKDPQLSINPAILVPPD